MSKQTTLDRPATARPRHAAPDTQAVTALPAIPDDVLAFTSGPAGDPNQVRAFWVRGDDPHLELEGGGLPPGFAMRVDLAKIPEIAALLRESNGFAPFLAVTR